MKKNLFLYLFIFSLLINIFTYVYFSNRQEYEGGRIETLEKRITVLKDSVEDLAIKYEDAGYFALENNTNARDYFMGEDIDKLAIKVRDGIYALNANEQGNPLVEYPVMDGRRFSINKIKVLNNRWVIADFSNGSTWGEVIIKYFIEDDGTVTYETAETLLHTNTMN